MCKLCYLISFNPDEVWLDLIATRSRTSLLQSGQSGNCSRNQCTQHANAAVLPIWFSKSTLRFVNSQRNRSNWRNCAHKWPLLIHTVLLSCITHTNKTGPSHQSVVNLVSSGHRLYRMDVLSGPFFLLQNRIPLLCTLLQKASWASAGNDISSGNLGISTSDCIIFDRRGTSQISDLQIVGHNLQLSYQLHIHPEAHHMSTLTSKIVYLWRVKS